MTTPSFKTHREARAAGWFSRRHRTRDAHDNATLARQARLDAKMARAREQNRKTAERKLIERAA